MGHKTEEELKTDIFNIYSHCMDEISSDRRQTYFGQLCDKIYRLCRDYLFIKEAHNMGEEICKIVNRLIKSDNINLKSNENEFFMNLKTALNNAKNEYYRENEQGLINIPKNKKEKIKQMKNILIMEESNIGRKLTEIETTQCLSRWFDLPENKINKYLEMLVMETVGNLTGKAGNIDDEMDMLNSTVSPPYIENISNSPLDEYITGLNAEIICEAVKSVLEKKQQRSRDCYKALFTLFCVEKLKDYEGLYPVLDHEILESCQKGGTQPKQYEIYLKYHPKAKKSSANALASKILNEFLGDLKSCIKEKI